MPVIDGVFVERTTLCLAERQVDWAAMDAHVLQQRAKVEAACQPPLNRLGVLAEAFLGLMPQPVLDDLTTRLRAALDRTARFGFQAARREVRDLRDQAAARGEALPDVGQHAEDAAGGLDGVRALINRRSREVAHNVADAVNEAAAKPGLDATERALAIAAAGRRALHLNVLELVGETLNMGRTAGVMTMTNPPEFAMRSEQLDKNTCEACDRVHGEIAQVGSTEYFQLLPPSYCYGGGRCRGVMVFGDGPVDLRVPLPEAA